MTSFGYDIINLCDLIWFPVKYGSIRDSNSKENVPPSFHILYMVSEVCAIVYWLLWL